jgi:hypothetical protein
MIVHPETVKAIETVHYHLEHNLPIRTEVFLLDNRRFFFLFLNIKLKIYSIEAVARSSTRILHY